jgi:S1-C subfamily serine protease
MKKRAPLQSAALALAVFLFAIAPVSARAAPASGSAGYLGISVVGVPDYLRGHVDLPEGIGMLITRVMPDGPGDKAGLKAHDILLSFGDQLVGQS